MKKISILFLLIIYSTACFSQSENAIEISSDRISKDDPRFVKRHKNRFGIWLTPTLAKSINGITIGLYGRDTYCDLPAQTSFTSNGLKLNIITNTLFMPLNASRMSLSKYYSAYGTDSVITAEANKLISIKNYQSRLNGIGISAFGMDTERVNGIIVSPWASSHVSMNGLAVNGLWNYFYRSNGISIAAVNSSLSVNGIQIGLFNQTIKLTGIQFGLWNKNEKRSLPFLNWDF